MTRHRKQNRSRAAGFALLELIAALFVLAVGLMGALQMHNVIAAKLRHMDECQTAARAVDAEIETLRAMPFNQLADRENAPFVSEPFGTGDLVNFTPSLTIRPHTDANLKLKHVTAAVRWTGENGRTIEKSAATLIAERGTP